MKIGSITQKSYTEYFGAVSFSQLHVEKCKSYAALGSEVKLLNFLNLFISVESFTIDALIFSLVAYQMTKIFNNCHKKKRDICNCQTINCDKQKASSHYTIEPIENTYNSDHTAMILK